MQKTLTTFSLYKDEVGSTWLFLSRNSSYGRIFNILPIIYMHCLKLPATSVLTCGLSKGKNAVHNSILATKMPHFSISVKYHQYNSRRALHNTQLWVLKQLYCTNRHGRMVGWLGYWLVFQFEFGAISANVFTSGWAKCY